MTAGFQAAWCLSIHAVRATLTIACERGDSEREQFAKAILRCCEAEDADFELNLLGRYPEACDFDAA